MDIDGSLSFPSPSGEQKQQEVIIEVKVDDLIFSIFFSAWHSTNSS